MQITVAALIVRFMERLGISHIYGMPGSHILPVYDHLFDSSIASILVKHEQGAAFMAGGHARASGGIGACITTAGPGATNLVTGIANAYADKLPILIVTGETSTFIFGKGGLQESSGEGGSIDQAALFGSITRYHRIVERTDYLLQVLRQATQVLLSANPGPVLLSLPYNVQKELVDASLLDEIRFGKATHAAGSHATASETMARMIRAARHPVIVAGYGCLLSGAQVALRQLGIPVATTLKGKGVVDEDTPLALGCLGVTSDGAARRYLIEYADLLIVLGASFNERTSYLWDRQLTAGRRIAQVDRDPAQLGRVFQPDVAVCGDILAVVRAVHEALANANMPKKALPAAEPAPPTATADASSDDAAFTLVRAFFSQLAARFSRDTMVFDDNIVFAQSYYAVSGRNHYFPNTGVSSLGYALPAAIGARCFAPDSPTFAILGDGGFQMCATEMMTAVNYGIPLNVVVINNGTLSLIRKNQFQHYGERYIDCDFVNPDFALLAQSFGARHFRVAELTDLDALFAHADLERGLNLIEILLDKHVFPRYLSTR